MRRIAGYLLLGFSAYLLALAWLFPARHALGLASLLDGVPPLAVADVRGRVWSGSAQGVRLNALPPLRLDWELQPLALLTGGLAASWQADTEGAHLTGVARADLDGAVALSAVEGRLPVQLLVGRLPLPVVLGGDLGLRLDRLELAGGRPKRAEGVLVWNGARVQAPQELALGDFRVNLTTRDDGGVIGQLSDAGGPLEASGEVTFDPDGSYRVNALLATRPGAPEALVHSLPLLGRKAPNGKFLVTYSGRV